MLPCNRTPMNISYAYLVPIPIMPPPPAIPMGFSTVGFRSDIFEPLGMLTVLSLLMDSSMNEMTSSPALHARDRDMRYISYIHL